MDTGYSVEISSKMIIVRRDDVAVHTLMVRTHDHHDIDQNLLSLTRSAIDTLGRVSPDLISVGGDGKI